MKKHRILYLVGAYPQWSETFVRQDLAFLQELGLPLLPVALSAGDAERQADWPEVEYLPGGEAGSSAAGSGGIPPRLLPRWLHTRLSLFRHRQRAGTLLRLAVSAGVEHIHAEFADLPALLASVTARRLGLGYSVGVHARDVHLAKFSPSLIYGGLASWSRATGTPGWGSSARTARSRAEPI